MVNAAAAAAPPPPRAAAAVAPETLVVPFSASKLTANVGLS